MEPFIQDVMFWHSIWKSAERPNTVALHTTMVREVESLQMTYQTMLKGPMEKVRYWISSKLFTVHYTTPGGQNQK